ncbi:MAG: type VI secretion system tip protein TssI/VgrG [Planctomycetota bacterium]
MTYVQDSRPCFVSSPTGSDDLLLVSLEGQEAISELFEYRIEVLSTESSIDPDLLVGQPLAVGVELARGGIRTFHGIVASFSQTGTCERFVKGRATLVPWLWLLTHSLDCRIFQNQTVPDIVSGLFDELGFSDYELRLEESYKERLYCVQYHETTYDFIARLLEEEGIHFSFRHELDRHVLVLTDTSSSTEALPNEPTIRFAQDSPHACGVDEILEWQWERSLHSGSVAATDFEFELPSLDLETRRETLQPDTGATGLESFEYHPGTYNNHEDGDRAARLKVEALEARAVRAIGTGNCRAMQSGYQFELKGHFDPKLDGRSYLIHSVRHRLTQTAPFETGTGLAVVEYENTFECLPIERPFRPARSRRRPRITGPQTARVVGPEGEEIHVDELGRIKCSFHWDRRSPRNENSSCWIRVARSAAGKGWGTVHHPRIGQEVVVEFLEGDPDRPLVVGSVYNGECRPPFELPANKTVSGLKTDSTPEAEGFNELRFEDRAGQEQIFLHAQKDFDLVVENDRHEHVKRHRHLIVDGDRIDEVKKNRHGKVEKSSFESIGVDRNITIGGKEAKKVQGAHSLIVSGNSIDSIGGDRTNVTTGKHEAQADTITLNAMSSIKIVCGGSSITISPGAVQIESPIIELNGSIVNLNASVLSEKGSIISLDGPVQCSGAVQAPLIQVGSGQAGSWKAGSLNALSINTAKITSATYSPGAGNIM